MRWSTTWLDDGRQQEKNRRNGGNNGKELQRCLPIAFDLLAADTTAHSSLTVTLIECGGALRRARLSGLVLLVLVNQSHEIGVLKNPLIVPSE